MESGPQPSAPTTSADSVEVPVTADVAALARGEPDAVQAFCRDLLEPVYAFVYWRVDGVKQDAEDVTQETLMIALESIDRFEGRSSLHTWVCGIARNLARERVRARGRDATGGVPPPDPATPPDLLLERAQTERLVGLALTELAPHYQQALLDKYVHHRSFAEMASASRSTAKAVESTVQRAKRALSEVLGRLGVTRPDGESHE
jgi:RNA polymerase sigma-70 factor, ECF subfamily